MKVAYIYKASLSPQSLSTSIVLFDLPSSAVMTIETILLSTFTQENWHLKRLSNWGVLIDKELIGDLYPCERAQPGSGLSLLLGEYSLPMLFRALYVNFPNSLHICRCVAESVFLTPYLGSHSVPPQWPTLPSLLGSWKLLGFQFWGLFEYVRLSSPHI